MKKEDVIFERKEFLNLIGHYGMANIVAQIIAYPKDKGGYRGTSCTLDFADCDRKISMDIDLDDEYSRENALFKVDTLIDVLTEYRSALKKEVKNIKKIERKQTKLKSKKDMD